MTRETCVHRQGVRGGPEGGSIGLLTRNCKVTLHTIGCCVVVMGKLDIGQGAREPQDLAVFACVTLSALRRRFAGSELRVTLTDFRMAFNALLMRGKGRARAQGIDDRSR